GLARRGWRGRRAASAPASHRRGVFGAAGRHCADGLRHRPDGARRCPPAALPAQLLALATYDMVLSRADQTRASDSVESLLKRLGVFDPQLATFMRANNDTRRLFEGRAGKQVQARVSTDGQPLELVARFAPPNTEQAGTHFTRLSVKREGDQWRASSELARLDTQVRVAGGT